MAHRVRERLEEIERSIPSASLEAPDSEGRTEASEIDVFLTEVLHKGRPVTGPARSPPRGCRSRASPSSGPRRRAGALRLRRGGRRQRRLLLPRRRHHLHRPGCSRSELWRGVADELPRATRAGVGPRDRVTRGSPTSSPTSTPTTSSRSSASSSRRSVGGSAAFELQADCLAGVWANSVYRAGQLQPGDVEEAQSTALAVGDFEVRQRGHHGTPEQRRAAWLLGFRAGEPSECSRYVPA